MTRDEIMTNKKLYLKCDRIFIGDGNMLRHAAVAVEGNRIKAVQDASESMPTGFEVIELPDATLLPGLIDCHTHITLDGSSDPFAKSLKMPREEKLQCAKVNAEKTLRAGITTIRDMGGAEGVDLELRNAISSGMCAGPRIMVSGHVICGIKGHGWPIGREVRSNEDAVSAVQEQLRAGADLIKFMVTGGAMTSGSSPEAQQLTDEELHAAVAEAHRAGKRTAAHAKGRSGILAALHAGIDSIEHGTMLSEEAADWMRKHRIPVVFTLSALYNMEQVGASGGIPAEILEKALRYKPNRQQSIALAQKHGLITALGTDAGTPYNRHGENPGELERMVEAGYTPEQALEAATGVAAQILGLDDCLGTIAAGKLADLIVVRDNPVKNIELFSDPSALLLVMKNGDIL